VGQSYGFLQGGGRFVEGQVLLLQLVCGVADIVL
jgi:hypothetical protein